MRRFWTWLQSVWGWLLLIPVCAGAFVVVGCLVVATLLQPRPPVPPNAGSQVVTSPIPPLDQDRRKLATVEVDALKKESAERLTETGKKGFDRGVEYGRDSGMPPAYVRSPGRREVVVKIPTTEEWTVTDVPVRQGFAYFFESPEFAPGDFQVSLHIPHQPQGVWPLPAGPHLHSTGFMFLPTRDGYLKYRLTPRTPRSQGTWKFYVGEGQPKERVDSFVTWLPRHSK